MIGGTPTGREAEFRKRMRRGKARKLRKKNASSSSGSSSSSSSNSSSSGRKPKRQRTGASSCSRSSTYKFKKGDIAKYYWRPEEGESGGEGWANVKIRQRKEEKGVKQYYIRWQMKGFNN